MTERTAVRVRQAELYGQAMLPEICINIRHALNGAADPWPDGDYEIALEFLKDVLRTWHHPKSVDRDWCGNLMDDAVLQMVKTATAMLEVREMETTAKN